MNESQSPIAQSKSQQLYWMYQIVGWGAFTLARIAGAITAFRIPWFKATLELGILGVTGLVLSHGLRAYIRRHHWNDLSIPQLTKRIIVAGLVLGTPLGILTQLTAVAALQDLGPLLREYAPGLDVHFSVPIQFAHQIVNWALLFMLWLAIYFTAIGLREYRSARLTQSELARALQLAELRLLKSQLNPHFLFNALNTVRSLIADNPARAQDAVTRLAKTLRYTLTSPQDELVTLSQELGIVADYLELESMRFEDRLRIELHVPDDAAGVQIPVMLLQTLVENAIKHGIAQLPSGGLLRVSATVQSEMLMLDVENPRPPAPARRSQEGVGLQNARDRLRLLFGERASLELDLSRPSVATARLRIPVNP